MKKDTTKTHSDTEPIVIQRRPVGRPPGRKDSAPRKRKDVVINQYNCEKVDPGDNSRYLGHALTIASQPLIDLNNIDEVKDRIDWYFNFCFEKDMKPTVAGFCSALNVNKQTLQNWRQGKFRDESYQNLILQAYEIMEQLWEHYMLNGKINPVSGIFLGKNLWGYADKQEMVVTPNATTTVEAMDQKVIEAKYAELPPIDDED